MSKKVINFIALRILTNTLDSVSLKNVSQKFNHQRLWKNMQPFANLDVAELFNDRVRPSIIQLKFGIQPIPLFNKKCLCNIIKFIRYTK